jgi:hypothetical protein
MILCFCTSTFSFDRFSIPENEGKRFYSLEIQRNTHTHARLCSLSSSLLLFTNMLQMKANFFYKKLFFYLVFMVGLRTIELIVLRWDDDESVENGLKVIVRHSKTDQAGRGFYFVIPVAVVSSSASSTATTTTSTFLGICPVALFSLY